MDRAIIRRAQSTPITAKEKELRQALLPGAIVAPEVMVDAEVGAPVVRCSYSNIQTLPENEVVGVWQSLKFSREEAEAAGFDVATLERLWVIENSLFGKLRFANIAILPEKLLRYFTTREVDMAILHRQLLYKPSPHLLTAGRGIPRLC